MDDPSTTFAGCDGGAARCSCHLVHVIHQLRCGLESQIRLQTLTNWTFVTYFVKLCTHMSPRMSPTMFKHREIQRFTQANCSLLSHLSL